MSILTWSPPQWHPSYKQGFARNASEAANPGLWDGLVGAWAPTLGVTGLSLQDIANGNTGTLSDSGMWAVGPNGPVLRCNGTSDTATVQLDPSTWTGYSSAVWFRTNVTNSTDVLTDLRFAGIDGIRMTLTNDKIIIHVDDGSFAEVVSPTGLFPDLTLWRHAVGVVDGDNALLYLDGELVAGPGAGNTFDFAGADGLFSISGRNGGTALFFDGDIDQVGVWQRPLTPSEIKQLYDDQYALIRPAAMPMPMGTVGVSRQLINDGLVNAPMIGSLVG